MSDDRRDFTGSDETTGELRDATIDFGEEFGVVKFADSDDSASVVRIDSTDTSDLPQWNKPPTSETPRFGVQPRDSGGPTRDGSRGTGDTGRSRTTPPPVSRRAPEGRINIGGDMSNPVARRPSDTHPTMRGSTGERRRPTAGDRSPRRPAPVRPAQVRRDRPQRSDSGTQPRPVGSDRNLSSAVLVGLVLVGLFIATSLISPAAVMALVVVVLGLASLEFFTQTAARNIPAPMVIGVVACIALPIGTYYMAHNAIVMIVAFALVAGAITMVGSGNDASSAFSGIGALMLGVSYVGLLGSFAALILRISTLNETLVNVGTDTLFLAVVGIAANDIGAYFVGSAIGRTPMRASISPNKTIEGLIGGTIATFAVVVVFGMRSGTWNQMSEWILLAAVIAVMAPLGDLFESSLKRSLGVKDFGTLLKGHGGVLDRFDGVLFALPAVYFLTVTLTPWAS